MQPGASSTRDCGWGIPFCYSQLWAIAEELVRQTVWLTDVTSLPGFGSLSPGRSYQAPWNPSGAVWGSHLWQTRSSDPISTAMSMICCLPCPDYHAGNFPTCFTESDGPPGNRARPGPCILLSLRDLGATAGHGILAPPDWGCTKSSSEML